MEGVSEAGQAPAHLTVAGEQVRRYCIVPVYPFHLSAMIKTTAQIKWLQKKKTIFIMHVHGQSFIPHDNLVKTNTSLFTMVPLLNQFLVRRHVSQWPETGSLVMLSQPLGPWC